MRRISPNNPVRRCLFPEDDVAGQARIDNFANILQESVITDRKEKIRKWNFDFENEIPLEGAYEWFRRDGDKWVGYPIPKLDVNKENISVKDSFELSEEDRLLQMKIGNETTPKSMPSEETVPLRKRKKEDSKVNDKGVRRKISFD